MHIPYGKWLYTATLLGLIVFLVYVRWVDSSIIHQYFISPYPAEASITYAVVFFIGGLFSIKRLLLADAIDERILLFVLAALLFYGCGFMLWNL